MTFAKQLKKTQANLKRDRHIQEKYGVKSDLIMRVEAIAKTHYNKIGSMR